MKKALILFILLGICSYNTFCQSPVSLVYDTRNDINQCNNYLLNLKNFGEAVTQCKTLVDIYNFYKKVENTLQKVNRAVNDIKYVEHIIKSQVNLIRWYGYYVSTARGFQYVDPKNISELVGNLTLFLDDSKDLLNMSKLLLKSDYYKMSDAERIKFLQDIDDRMSENYTGMQIEYNHLYIVNRDAEIRKTIKNW